MCTMGEMNSIDGSRIFSNCHRHIFDDFTEYKLSNYELSGLECILVIFYDFISSLFKRGILFCVFIFSKLYKVLPYNFSRCNLNGEKEMKKIIVFSLKNIFLFYMDKETIQIILDYTNSQLKQQLMLFKRNIILFKTTSIISYQDDYEVMFKSGIKFKCSINNIIIFRKRRVVK